jgi:enoyl-CoA hydratase/carnithine racemase
VSEALTGIDYLLRDGVATVTLNRPPANAFSAAMYGELARVAQQLSEDESVRVAILTAAGERIFCGGADVKELRALDDEGRAAFSRASEHAAHLFAAIPVPVIAAITGACVGAGVAYATRCDYRISAEHATFTLPEINLGFLFEGGRTLISAGVPSGPLRMMLYSGRTASAAEALGMRLVDEVVPGSRVMEAAEQYAGVLATKSRENLIRMKAAINRMSYTPPPWT